MEAPIRYAKSGDVNIAYQVTGDGPFDLVLVHGFFSHLELDWEHPASRRINERLSSFSRLIRFDKRGTGLSDRAVGLPDFEARMDDVRAVMDAVGSERAALFGYSEGGPMCVLFAATYPERTRALVLYGTYAKRLRSDDYPWAPTWENRLEVAAELERTWGEDADISVMAPNGDEGLRRWFIARGRAALSPGGARDLILMNSHADVREALGAVQAPTLVLHRTGDRDSNVEEGRYIAERIPGAIFRELPGEDHVPMVDPDQVLVLFDGPARAIRCALELRDRLAALGLEVRAGVHTGEVERPRGAPPRGIAVHVGARVAAQAGAGEVLVSATTRDLVAGSGLTFEDRGEFELKGLDERRRLYAATA